METVLCYRLTLGNQSRLLVCMPQVRGEKTSGFINKKTQINRQQSTSVTPEVCVKLGDTPEISSQHSSEVMAAQETNLCNKKFVFQVKIRL